MDEMEFVKGAGRIGFEGCELIGEAFEEQLPRFGLGQASVSGCGSFPLPHGFRRFKFPLPRSFVAFCGFEAFRDLLSRRRIDRRGFFFRRALSEDRDSSDQEGKQQRKDKKV
jgi:hypothetical protein